VKPRVGISRCLLGDDVRYDGTNKRSSAVMTLGEKVEWVPVCPEVEIGMGVPREPIQLVASADGVASASERVRLQGAASHEDWTGRVDRWARDRVAAFASERLSGFVLKARSPSCGPAGVLVHHGESGATPTGRGLFAEAIAAAMPDLPMIDEESLEDPAARADFIQRVREFEAGTSRTNK
jgi:uncharacterized protein YbbK (DUF523 family)